MVVQNCDVGYKEEVVILSEGCGEGEVRLALSYGETSNSEECGRRRMSLKGKGLVLLVLNDVGFGGGGGVGVGNRGVGCQEGTMGGLGVAFFSLLCSNSS